MSHFSDPGKTRLIPENAFSLPERIAFLKDRISHRATRPVNIMEVCGTHTVAIARSGLRQVIPANVRLLSGPGCPVCVTSTGDIDRVIALAQMENIQILSFGDMLHVPGSQISLEQVRAERGNVKIIYSPMDALNLAERNPSSQFVFVGVGFETTTPLVAAMVLAAQERKIRNLTVAPLFKRVSPALHTILGIDERRIDGFILPGHVSAIIGLAPYDFIAEEYETPGVVSGFEALDILEALDELLGLLEKGKASIVNRYERGVTREGNVHALETMNRVFEPIHAEWRAIGTMPLSGLGFKPRFKPFDAFERFHIPHFHSVEPKGCRCGQILLGLCGPRDCPIFRKFCTPSNPVGPCMVSSEGACAAAYHYGEDSL